MTVRTSLAQHLGERSRRWPLRRIVFSAAALILELTLFLMAGTFCAEVAQGAGYSPLAGFLVGGVVVFLFGKLKCCALLEEIKACLREEL